MTLPKTTTDVPRPYDLSIHHNPDAAAWARFFVETWPHVHPDRPVPDEGWMLGWFANAMMAMHDHILASEEGAGRDHDDGGCAAAISEAAEAGLAAGFREGVEWAARVVEASAPQINEAPIIGLAKIVAARIRRLDPTTITTTKGHQP